MWLQPLKGMADSVTDYREFEVSLVGIRDSYRITTNRVKVEQEV